MSTPTATTGPPIYQHVRATKDVLQGVIFGEKIVAIPDKAEFDALEQDAFEILRLIRFWRNTAAPINRIPPEILSLIPDYWYTRWETCDRGQDVVSLTHVCRAWRDLFTSRSLLWTDVGCEAMEKAEVYLGRSKSSPVNLSLRRAKVMSPDDPFFRIIPLAIGRLKSLRVEGMADNLHDIAAHLSHPVPLLERLSVSGGDYHPTGRNPILPLTLFNEDLSSLRELSLDRVRTKLPWRNMVNLTSFTLSGTLSVSMRQLLDFFEGAPHLREVGLFFATPAYSSKNGRLVSLACLRRIIINGGPPPVLLGHLLIPVGAELVTHVQRLGPFAEDHLPKSFDNLRNLSDFTTIRLCGGSNPYVQLSGPNGRVKMISTIPRIDEIHALFESLNKFDTSKTEQLEIDRGVLLSSDPLYRALLPMKDLRTLVLSRCPIPRILIDALNPGMNPSGVLVCPKLEEIVIKHTEAFDIEDVTGTVAERASRGAKLKLVRIVGQDKSLEIDMPGLGKHALQMECIPQVDGTNDSDGGNKNS